MKKSKINYKKALILVLCAVLLVCGSVAGTLAYLTSVTGDVVNTITIGDVNIDLDETDVNEDGVKDGDTRVKKNDYRLVPDRSYTKDPVLHFKPGSVASWLFVEVNNPITGLEAAAPNVKIADQILAHNWTLLENSGNVSVYYREAPENKTGADMDYPVFDSFKIDAAQTKSTLAPFQSKQITVKGYAIQKAESLTSAAEAWAAVKAAPAP